MKPGYGTQLGDAKEDHPKDVEQINSTKEGKQNRPENKNKTWAKY